MNSIGVILIKTLKKGCRIYGLKERNPPLVYSYLGVFHHVSLVEYIQEGIYIPEEVYTLLQSIYTRVEDIISSNLRMYSKSYPF